MKNNLGRIRVVLRRNPGTVLGAVILLALIATAVFAPVFSPYDPMLRTGRMYEAPSAAHLLGTNDIGQDILSEMIYGTRVSLSIGFAGSLAGVLAGTILGMAAGYFRGIWDLLVRSATGIMMAVAGLPLTMFLISILGGSVNSMVVIIAVTGWAGTARVVRARVMELREEAFIRIEEMMGVSKMRILFSHILPNISEMVLLRFSLGVGSAILTESSLSFLGLGTYGQKSWGNVLHFAYYRGALLRNMYWWYLPPIVCITLVMAGVTLISHKGLNRESFGKENSYAEH